MNPTNNRYIRQAAEYHSAFLKRPVLYDVFMPQDASPTIPRKILLINDGQDLEAMDLLNTLNQLSQHNLIQPLICVGIHASENRRQEYGTARTLDYLGRGTLSEVYQQFVTTELIPFLRKEWKLDSKQLFGFLGRSLGGLSALDTVWRHAHLFDFAGVFSGALWWRDKDQNDVDFDERQHRIMHRQIKDGEAMPHLRFFFEAGGLDETADRNNNGIIDSIDDTLDIIRILKEKGFDESAIEYLELSNGAHDILTWKQVLPECLKWAYCRK